MRQLFFLPSKIVGVGPINPSRYWFVVLPLFISETILFVDYFVNHIIISRSHGLYWLYSLLLVGDNLKPTFLGSSNAIFLWYPILLVVRIQSNLIVLDIINQYNLLMLPSGNLT